MNILALPRILAFDEYWPEAYVDRSSQSSTPNSATWHDTSLDMKARYSAIDPRNRTMGANETAIEIECMTSCRSRKYVCHRLADE